MGIALCCPSVCRGWCGYGSRSSVEGHHQLYKSGHKLQVKDVSSPQGRMSVQWGQRLNVAANFCQPPWRRAHLSLDFQLCCPVCSEFLLPAKACGTMVRGPLCMLGLSRLIRCYLQPLFCLVNSELLPLILLGLPLLPDCVIPAAKLALAREACDWGRNFPPIKNKVVCDPEKKGL